MKVIRSYRLVQDVLYCRVDFLPEDADFQDENHWSATGPEYCYLTLSAVVGPSSRRLLDFKVESSNCSRSLLLDEIVRFCQTLKQMYQL